MAKDRFKCSCCGTERPETDFYASQSYINKDTGKLSVCKHCLWDYVITEEYGYDLEKMKDILQMIDKPFSNFILDSSIEEGERDNKNIFKVYMKNLGLKQNRHLRWKDGDFGLEKIKLNKPIEPSSISAEKSEEVIKINELDNKNKEDVLKMLGYDPFESENKTDKMYLYNRLVDFLDESTLEDSFKLPAVIEIVKSFNQIDKINLAIAKLTANPDSLASNVGSMKSLMETKDKVLKSVLALAKDNGISVNHNNNKSKGGGTLSGIIKQLQEKGFSEADVNLFDIETSLGMRQVADLSNESIIKQLQFDENDYTEMIMQQREIIHELDEKVIKFEEENRKLKKELLNGNKNVEMINNE